MFFPRWLIILQKKPRVNTVLIAKHFSQMKLIIYQKNLMFSRRRKISNNILLRTSSVGLEKVETHIILLEKSIINHNLKE